MSLLLISSCSPNNNFATNKINENNVSITTNDLPFDVVTELKTLGNGKTYVDYLGSPFLGTGVQIRTDAYMNSDKLTMEEMEIFFEKAKKLGKGYTGILSRILENALNNPEILKQCQ